VHYPIRVKNRANVVTSLEYDLLKRLIKRTEASHTEPTPGNLVANSDVNQKNITDYTYGNNSRIVIEQITNGRKTMSQYDYRHRVIESKSWPYAGTMLSTKTNYLNNRVFYTEDAYGRREYMGYSVSNASELIRRVTTGPAGYAIANFPAVMDLNRLSAPAAVVSIADAIKDSNGNLKEVIDGRGIVTKYEYDTRDREIRRKDAFGTPVEAITETSYDAAGNVVEVRSPRYFDSSDPQKDYMKTLFTYTGRGAQKTQTVAPGGGSAEALTSQTYDLEGKVATSTDASGNVWTNDYSDDCCGHFSGRIDPLGHGSMTNMDAMGRAVHSATVKDYATHTLKADPDNAKTLAESTTRYDLLGRTRARTTWLTALGPIVKENPQIAGYDGVPLANGLTSQVYYDVNLKDGIGLDGTGGLTITKMTGSAPGETFTITSAQFAAVMNKLAEPIASGGAGLTFTANESAPSAVISINAEDELSVSISDGMGRGVMTAQIQPWDGPQPFTLVTWGCQKHDTIYNLAGVGNVLESISVDANGKTVKSHADGAGRTLQTVDQLGKISTSTYDASGNVLSVRDPNGVGYDAVYDQLGRLTSQTDTFGDVTSSTYDKGGNVKTRTDAKGKATTMVYDAQNRLKTTTDRLGGVTTNNFNCCRLVSIVDAEGQMTSYTYNTRGEKIKETYPDHIPNSAVGTSGYGIVEFLYDEAGRLKRKIDQVGDTCTFNYDLAGRMLQKDYRTLANSPSGTIADSDAFTFDRAGRMLTAASGRYTNTVTQVFDSLGRHKEEKLTIAGQTYTITHDFDSLGRPFKMTYPDGTVTEKTFTDRGQLYETKYGGSVIDTRTYDDGGRLSTSTYSNGAVTTHNYRVSGSSKDNLLTSIVTTNPGTNKVGTYSYTWDANKNKTAETITNSPLSGYGFSTGATGYDDENRVTAWNRSDNNQNQTWNLSLVGDWNNFNQTGTSPLTQTRTHGPTHEFTSFTGTNSGTITYDVKGNMTSRPASLAAPALNLVWDYDNKLKGADIDNTPATLEVTFNYDALGRRVSRSESGSTVIYLQSGQQTIADYASGAPPASPTYRYVYGSYIDEPLLRETATGSIRHFFHRNQQYSITALSNSSGDTVERYSYTAYGGLTVFDSTESPIATSVLSNRFSYTGREWDSTLAMFFFRARWYDGTAGRFIGRDPLEFVDGMSLYQGYFVDGGVDPMGDESHKICCTFDNGSKIWSITYWASSLQSAQERCKQRATWGLGKDWTIVGAREGGCDEPERDMFFVHFNDQWGRNSCESTLDGCGCDHVDLVSTNQGHLLVGIHGPGNGVKIKKGPRDLVLRINKSSYWTLRNGIGAGKRCDQVTDNEIADCVKNESLPWSIFAGGFVKNKGGAFNNCQTHIKDAARHCCLSGFRPSALPGRGFLDVRWIMTSRYTVPVLRVFSSCGGPIFQSN
jgi:RHS repeat-associated protein